MDLYSQLKNQWKIKIQELNAGMGNYKKVKIVMMGIKKKEMDVLNVKYPMDGLA